MIPHRICETLSLKGDKARDFTISSEGNTYREVASRAVNYAHSGSQLQN